MDIISTQALQAKGLGLQSLLNVAKSTIRATGIAFTMSLLAMSAHAGFSVSGTQLLDANGETFIMRGVNHPHAWYTGETGSFADIAATGANAVRVVLSDGQQWTRNSASDVANVISLCKQNQLVCVLEVHDVTGSGEESAAGTLANAAQYWVDIASVLEGEEDYVIINIANEPFGNNLPASTWINEHRSAIQTIRDAGLTHTLIVDAANWGQDWEEIMLNNASEVAAADSLNNTMFSVHMYEVYQNRSTIENYVSTFLDLHNLPLIVGEFGADHQGNAVDADSIMAVAEQYDIGYLGWSWSGNGSCCVSLDIVNNFNAESLTTWGDRLINGANGIAATSQVASVYDGGSSSSSSTSSSTSSTSSTSSSTSSSSTSTSSSSSSSTSSSGGDGQVCNWYGTTYPLCDKQSNGWGYENNQSCISSSTCGSQPAPYGIEGSSSSSSSTSSTSSSSSNGGNSGTCNWYGTEYPMCNNQSSGWGWENSKSCIGVDTCNAQ